MEAFITTIGYVGVFAIVFAESGLLIGFFLPGDSLLFTAGFLASLDKPIFSLPVKHHDHRIFLCFISPIP